MKVYIRVARWLASGCSALRTKSRYIREWLGGSPARQWRSQDFSKGGGGGGHTVSK